MIMNESVIDKINTFRDFLIEEEKSDATVEKYVRDVLAFIAWSEDRELTKTIVLDYKKHLVETYAPASVNSMLSSINAYFEFIERLDLKVKNIKIQKQMFSDKEKELSKEEYERLLNAAKRSQNEKLCLLMQTLCGCGLRVSELKFITTEAVKKRTATINCKGKLRMVIIPEKLCRMLFKYIKENNIKSGSVFVTRTGRPLDRSNIWRLMRSLCESAGVSKDKVFPHNLRHLFARTFYSIEKDVVRLADILGHSSINTTRIYTMETGEKHRRLVQKIGLLLC